MAADQGRAQAPQSGEAQQSQRANEVETRGDVKCVFDVDAGQNYLTLKM